MGLDTLHGMSYHQNHQSMDENNEKYEGLYNNLSEVYTYHVIIAMWGLNAKTSSKKSERCIRLHENKNDSNDLLAEFII